MAQYVSTEVFSPNPSINREIHDILQRFDDPSRSRMLRAIRIHQVSLDAQGNEAADASARHTFREFLIGREFRTWRFPIEYEVPIDGLTPDWFDSQSRVLVEVVTCERGGTSQPVDRMAAQVEKKATKYRAIVCDHSLRFVVAVYGDFCTFTEEIDFEDAITEGQLFERFSQISGLVFFTETDFVQFKQEDGEVARKQRYGFHYYPNPHADRRLVLPM